MYSNQEIELLKNIEFERREARLKNAAPQKLKLTSNQKEKLHITYVMTWTGICGGSKIILEHANRLTQKGHKITLISHDNKPEWFQLNKNIEFIQVPWEEILCKKIPFCDVIVATYWREIYECIEQRIAPVIYFEQGDYHLFDLQKLDNRKFKYIKKQFETVQFMYTVSNFARGKIKTIYNKESKVIPNAVDKSIFYPKNNKTKNADTSVAIIGSEKSTFKNIDDIINAVNILRNEDYKIKLKWITPDKPERNKIQAIINPPQIEIGNILRNSDIYICASMYESFCLPVLEAMTCGVAIITTNNGGNMDFVIDNKNALIIKKHDIIDLCEKIKLLIKDEDLRKSLAKNALITSKDYSWDKTISEIEKYYIDIARYKVI